MYRYHEFAETLMRICTLILAASLALALGCGPSSDSDSEPGAPAAVDPSGLSRDELENGIGPAKAPVELGTLDPALAAKGQLIFEQKCCPATSSGSASSTRPWATCSAGARPATCST